MSTVEPFWVAYMRVQQQETARRLDVRLLERLVDHQAACESKRPHNCSHEALWLMLDGHGGRMLWCDARRAMWLREKERPWLTLNCSTCKYPSSHWTVIPY